MFFNEYHRDLKRKREDSPKPTLLVVIEGFQTRLCFFSLSEIPPELKTGFQMMSKSYCSCSQITRDNADEEHIAHQLVMQDCFGVLDSKNLNYVKNVCIRKLF
jgi:hypothetical protein